RVGVDVGRQVLDRGPVAGNGVELIDSPVEPVVEQDLPARSGGSCGTGRSARGHQCAGDAGQQEDSLQQGLTGLSSSLREGPAVLRPLLTCPGDLTGVSATTVGWE